jgi:hypothetical protein
VVTVELEPFEQLASLPIWAAVDSSSVDGEHVEDDQHHVDPVLAVQHPVAEPWEARQAVAAERDQLTVDREAVREAGWFGDEAGHVPTAATRG